IVEDEIGIALANPAGLIFTGAVLQIEHRIALFHLCIVIRWQIDQRVPPATRYLRVVPDLPDLAVGRILNRVIGRTRLRNLDPTRFLGSTKERMRVEVADFHAIDDQRVVVKAGNERWSGNGPVSVLLFLHVHLRPAPEIQSDLHGVGSLDRKSTRLNSSHGSISYAVFCLKKKIEKMNNHERRR